MIAERNESDEGRHGAFPGILMSRFVRNLVVFTGISLLLIFGVHALVVWRPQEKMRQAARFQKSLSQMLKEDPRFQDIKFEGVGWSGPGHPVYIAVSGTVRSRADWRAFTNLVQDAHPPVQVSVGTIYVEEENGLGGFPNLSAGTRLRLGQTTSSPPPARPRSDERSHRGKRLPPRDSRLPELTP